VYKQPEIGKTGINSEVQRPRW